ncbi:MAG: hypothetical protein AAFY06_00150 [Pseudomonadota bacterium]
MSISDRLRVHYNRLNSPPSPELPCGSDVILDAAARVETLEAAVLAAEHILRDSNRDIYDRIEDAETCLSNAYHGPRGAPANDTGQH